jgi:hypothetical protein
MVITNKEIIEKLDCLEAGYSNGQIDEIHGTVNEIKEILLDPEDGIIVRVNKNTFWRRQVDADEFKALLRWKQAVTHSMWIAYTALIGIIVKIVFF